MPSSHLILCRPLLLLLPISPSIRVFSNESTLRMRWPRGYLELLIPSFLIVWVYEIVGFKGNRQILAEEIGLRPSWYKEWWDMQSPAAFLYLDAEMFFVGILEAGSCQHFLIQVSRCSAGHLQLSTYTLKPAGAKILIRSTWVLGATGHYMIKSLNNTPAEFKSESLDCSCHASTGYLCAE